MLCEEFIDGDEAHLPGARRRRATARALPVIRIVAPDGNYDYQNKYFTDDTGYHVPERPAGGRGGARSSASSLAAYRALGCRGWGRADLMIRASRPQALPAGDEHLARA